MGDAPGWAKHLAGVDARSVTSRAALARLPVLRKSRAAGLAQGLPAVRRLQRDAARQGEAAVHVARPDLRAGRPHARSSAARGRCSRPASAPDDVVLNSFSYHLTPGGFMFEAAARMRSAAR